MISGPQLFGSPEFVDEGARRVGAQGVRKGAGTARHRSPAPQPGSVRNIRSAHEVFFK